MSRPFVFAATLFAFACTDATTPDTTTPEPEPPSFCETEGFGREVPFDAVGPYGLLRHDLAEDFTVTLDDDTEWTLSENWTGCESYVFIPDWISATATNAGSVWDAGLDELVELSPENVHYFFVSMEFDADTARAALDAIGAQRDAVIDGLGKKKAEWWSSHVHVVKKRSDNLNNWIATMLESDVGQNGFAIDRTQHVRGVGSWADVRQYNAGAQWWDNALSQVRTEVEYYNMEAERQAAREAQAPATVIPLFTGEVISQFAEVDVTLPTAEEMAGFDTFEIEIDMQCPDPNKIEFGNCGAWDYLAWLFVQEDDGSWTELGRFITTYHREAHWVLDATPMMAHLLDGGTRHFKWEWAPYWNVQPTATKLDLRFSNQGKGIYPATITKVATGGAFNSLYNDGRLPVDVTIPADAVKTELVTIVTGHGQNQSNGCAEFCDHQHQFTVGSSVYFIEFPEAGTDPGCMDAGIANQMTPNQWGTWWFGRGGWCPGQLVVPQVFDISLDVTPGQTASVAYEGQFRGNTPPDASGDIVLNSWVVTYRQ